MASLSSRTPELGPGFAPGKLDGACSRRPRSRARRGSRPNENPMMDWSVSDALGPHPPLSSRYDPFGSVALLARCHQADLLPVPQGSVVTPQSLATSRCRRVGSAPVATCRRRWAEATESPRWPAPPEVRAGSAVKAEASSCALGFEDRHGVARSGARAPRRADGGRRHGST